MNKNETIVFNLFRQLLRHNLNKWCDSSDTWLIYIQVYKHIIFKQLILK